MKKSLYSGEIVDAHMHLWDRANKGYSWLDQPRFKSIRGNFLIEDYLKTIKNQRITKAVHVQSEGFPEDPVLETKWIQEIADKHGIPQGIIGYAALHHPEIENQLKRHCEYPNFRGIRMTLHNTEIDYMLDPAWQHGFSLLSKYNLSFDMLIFPEQTPSVLKLLKMHDDVPVILNHLAMSYSHDFDFWLKSIRQLASIPSTFMKISGVGQYFKNLEHADTICKFIEHAIDVFGVDRCMFSSNCPSDMAFIPLDSIFEIFKQVASKHQNEEQHMLFYENANRVYRL